jgi:hypothetical protein
VGRLLLLLLIVGVLSACGASGQIYAAAKTRSCLAAHGARIGPASDDLVASTATGGAFRAYLVGNFVTVVFGATVADAKNVDDAYRRFAAKNVGIDDVLFRQGNAVMLWHLQPQSDVSGVSDCLK